MQQLIIPISSSTFRFFLRARLFFSRIHENIESPCFHGSPPRIICCSGSRCSGLYPSHTMSAQIPSRKTMNFRTMSHFLTRVCRPRRCPFFGPLLHSLIVRKRWRPAAWNGSDKCRADAKWSSSCCAWWDSLLNDRSIGWLIDLLVHLSFYWDLVWLIDWLIDWTIDWLIDWTIDWLIDWLIWVGLGFSIRQNLRCQYLNDILK